MNKETHEIITLKRQDVLIILLDYLEIPHDAQIEGVIRFAEDDHLLAELVEVRIDYKHKETEEVK